MMWVCIYLFSITGKDANPINWTVLGNNNNDNNKNSIIIVITTTIIKGVCN